MRLASFFKSPTTHPPIQPDLTELELELGPTSASACSWFLFKSWFPFYSWFFVSSFLTSLGSLLRYTYSVHPHPQHCWIIEIVKQNCEIITFSFSLSQTVKLSQSFEELLLFMFLCLEHTAAAFIKLFLAPTQLYGFLYKSVPHSVVSKWRIQWNKQGWAVPSSGRLQLAQAVGIAVGPRSPFRGLTGNDISDHFFSLFAKLSFNLNFNLVESWDSLIPT